LFQVAYDHRELLLDSYLRAMIRRERFETQYEHFLNRVVKEQEEIVRRRSVTLEQMMSKHMERVNQLSSRVDTDSQLLPPIDEQLEEQLAQQYDRLSSYYSQRSRIESIDIVLDRDNDDTDDHLIAAMTDKVRASYMHDKTEDMTIEISSQVNRKLKHLCHEMMRLQCQFGIVDIQSALWLPSLNVRTRSDRILEGMMPYTEQYNTASADENTRAHEAMIRFYQDTSIDATRLIELRKEHKIEFYSIVQFVTQYVMLPHLETTLRKRFQKKLQGHKRMLLTLIASTKITREQKLEILQNLYNAFIQGQRELSPSVITRQLKALSTRYYEEYVFRKKEYKYYRQCIQAS